MGGHDEYTVSLGQDNIIRIEVVGAIQDTTSSAIAEDLNPLIHQLREGGKKILLLVDASQIEKIHSNATSIARNLIKGVEYDRAAVYSIEHGTIGALKHALHAVFGAKRLKSFNNQARAKFWLLRGRTPLRRKAARSLVIGIVLAILAVVWHTVIAPNSFKLKQDFTYNASLISRDNLYDEKKATFSGETLSTTKFSYESVGLKDGVVEVKNIFDVRTVAGEEIFSVERIYGVNPLSRQHVPGYGDNARNGFLFGPVGADKRDFTYWHVNYDVPITMGFQNEEEILGLTTYHYAANFHADQTEDLRHLPGVGETRGVNLDINLKLWIEPTTGHLVKYEDQATAYYYDLATGKRLHPWNRFSNSYSFESVAAHVQLADEEKEDKIVNEINRPVFFAILAAIFLVRSFILFRRERGQVAQSGASLYTRVCALVVVGGAGLALVGWVFDIPLLTQTHPTFASMHIVTAILFILVAVVLWLLAKKEQTRRAMITVRLLLTTVLIFGVLTFVHNVFNYNLGLDAILRLFGQESVATLSPITSICFVILSTTLLINLRAWSWPVGAISQLLLAIAFILALFGVIGYAFSLQELHNLPWYKVMALRTALLFLLTIPAVFMLHQEWALTKVARRFGRSLLWALLVLVLLLALTGVSWQQTIGTTAKLANIQFQGEAHSLHDLMADELSDNIKAAYSARGLFASSQEVSRDEWRAFVDSLGLSQNYPGQIALGYIQEVSASEKEAHVNQVRAEGFPNYAIHPFIGSRDTYSSVVYIEPFTDVNQRAFGYDMLTDSIRRTAMERARDTGEPVMTEKVILVQDKGVTDQFGIVLYLPVYANGAPVETIEQRRAALTGYIYAPIRMADFVRSTVGVQTTGFNVEIFDADSHTTTNVENRLFTSNKEFGIDNPGYRPDFARVETLAVGGNSLVVRYVSLPTYRLDVTLQSLPSAVLFVGVMLSFLIAAIIFLQSSSRSRALKLAETMTNGLRRERNIALTNHHKNEAILSSIGDGVFVLDTEGKIRLFNKAAELISGYSENEALGKPYKEILSFHSDQDNRSVEDFVNKALNGERSEMARHTVLKRKDGAMVPVADSAAPIVNAQGEREGAVVVFRDTTHERQLERMKDEFLSIASHELRTPMGAVRANLSMILDGDYGPVDKALVEPLTDMKDATIRLVGLVNDLLDVARIEAGRTKFVLGDLNLKEVIQETVSSLAPLAKEQGIAIVFSPGSDAQIQADRDKIKQVLTNLIGNSLKFTDKGSITLTTKDDKNYVVVKVVDTGLGITTADQRKLFNKFKQISSAQEGKPSGTGLGLYISRELIRKMGGELWIESSEVGKGSVFAFTLPLSGTPAARQVKDIIGEEAKLHPDQK